MHPMQRVANRRAGLAEGNTLDRGHALHRAVVRRVEVVRLQHLQPQADRVGGRWWNHQEADEALAALDHRPHHQRLQAVEVEPALGVAGGALRPALPGTAVRVVGPARGDAGADGVAGPEIDDAAGVGSLRTASWARRATVAAARPTSALALPPEGAQAEARWSCAAT